MERHISPQYTAPISLSASLYKPFCYYCRSSIKKKKFDVISEYYTP